MPKHRIRSLTALLILMAFVACKPDEPKKPTARQRAIKITNAAKEQIAAKEYAAAEDLCLRAEEVDDTYDEAKYCIVAANVGAMANAVSDILGLAATRLSPGAAFRPQLEVKPVVGTLLEDIEASIKIIDAYSFKLAKMENPKFHIAEFPLSFDPVELLKVTGVDEIKVAGELSMNLKGTWDMTEIHLLAGALNGVQGLLDYLMAHELVLDDSDIAFDSTGGVAAFLANNPRLLTGDAKDRKRLEGDAIHKGLKNDVIAALSYLVGRDADLANVAPANAGLIAAIKQSAIDADPAAVLGWTDKNGDGVPEQVRVPALEELRTQIVDQDGKPVLESSTFKNDLAAATWNEIVALAESLLANIEAGGGEPAPLAPVLASLVADLKAAHAATRVLQKPVPDVVALNPGVFFKSPKYIGEMLPFFYRYAVAGTAGTFYELAIDTENYDGADNYLEKMGLRHGLNAADFGHFAYAGNDGYSGAFTVASYTFDAFEAGPAAIAADGVMPTVKTPRLYYVALLDPSFGGMVLGDPGFKGDASGGNYAELTNLSLWKGVNKLLKYYCLDATTLGLAMFDDADAIYTSNKIADCAQALE